MEKSQGRFGIRQLVEMALLSGISFVLMFIAVPIIPIVPFMKLDLSDVVVLLGMVVFGPVGGLLIAAVKELLYFVATGLDLMNFIGILTAFIADAAFILPIHWVLSRADDDQRRPLVWAVLAGTLSLTVVLSLANWLVIMPLYLKVWGVSLGIPVNRLILLGVIPFNLIKGLVVGTVFALLSGRLQHWLVSHRQ